MKAIAQRYAAALVDVAVDSGTTEQLRKELNTFLQLFEGSADLRNFLASPAVPRAGKRAVIERIATRVGAGTKLRNFLFVITDNRRILLLGEIRDAFEALLHARLGIAEAQVTAAEELGPDERSKLVRTLERITGKKVEAHYSRDPNLLGGAVVRIGSTVYDGSIRAQLDRMRAKLAGD